MTLRAEKKLFSGRKPIGTFIITGITIAVFGVVIWLSTDKRDDTALSEIPVIRAQAGDIKFAPEFEGGRAVPYRDVSIYNNLDPAAGNDADRIERVIFSSEGEVAGLQFRDEKLLQDTARSVLEQERRQAAPNITQEIDDNVNNITDNVTGEIIQPNENALRQPTVRPQPAPAPERQEAQETEQRTAPAEQPKETASPREEKLDELSRTVRSILQEERTVPQTAPQQTQRSPVPAVPTTTGARTHFIQLGSVTSRSAASNEWERLQELLPNLLGNLNLRVEEANLGERGTFFRIQSSLVSKEDADRICAEIKASRAADCLVRRN